MLVMAVVLVVIAGCGGGETEGAGARANGDDRGRLDAAVVERLRGGGLVVAFRHAATDSSMDTTDDLADCSRQRNLSAAGRRQSRAIGRAFERLEIPVGRVLASPFCRARDTARIAFGRVKLSPALLSIEFRDDPGAGAPPLRRLLASEPRRANTVLVSHGSAIDEAAGVDPEEGAAIVAAPRSGARGFEILARPRAADWTAVAGRMARTGRTAE